MYPCWFTINPPIIRPNIRIREPTVPYSAVRKSACFFEFTLSPKEIELYWSNDETDSLSLVLYFFIKNISLLRTIVDSATKSEKILKY